MSWSWSHTQEAYENARENLSELSLEDLQVIYAEIRTSLNLNLYNEYNTEDTHSFDEDDYNFWMKNTVGYSKEAIIHFIWQYMSEDLRTCDNGGFNAYCCPYGCHTVSFDN